MKDHHDAPAPAPSGMSTPSNTAHPLRAPLARLTAGTSPVAAMSMMTDWALHLATAPDTQMALAHQAQQHWAAWIRYVARGCPPDPDQQPMPPSKSDRRFRHDAWNHPPYAAMAQAFLLLEDQLDRATSDIPGMAKSHDTALTFLARQMLDAVAPSNFLWTNPEALQRAWETQGHSLLSGAAAFTEDLSDALAQKPQGPSKRVGQDVALSEGRVVLRTHLMELIQYAPTTPQVRPEPVLLVPAWIMKYYILDLSPENSMVRYLTDQGFTVYAISWRNPGAEDAALGMEDYLDQGPRAALDHICGSGGPARVHGVGYCLGGTLLSMAAAQMARDGDARWASMTLLAAQTDFSDAGELMLFINESQLSFLEDVMAAQGYLDAQQMMSAFQMLRSNDLIWSQKVRKYLLGEPDPEMNDLMSWNADTTRMPARMHSEYLRRLFLNNDLAAGRYDLGGHAISLRDIRLPVFAVGTETDHIAPWTSVFKIHTLAHTDVTFVLTNGGHNAGVISKPGHPRRHYRLHTTHDHDRARTPEDWMAEVPLTEGSWWPAWVAWLSERSGAPVAPPTLPHGLGPAPGTYVMQS